MGVEDEPARCKWACPDDCPFKRNGECKESCPDDCPLKNENTWG